MNEGINWFIFAGGMLWLIGAGSSLLEGDWKMATISTAYAIAQFVLAGIKG